MKHLNNSTNHKQGTLNIPRIANCFEGSFGGPRALFVIMKISPARLCSRVSTPELLVSFRCFHESLLLYIVIGD